MIVACSNCSTRFLVSAAAVGVHGRTVRCGRCGHVWEAAPLPELARLAAGELDGPAPGRPDRAAVPPVGEGQAAAPPRVRGSVGPAIAWIAVAVLALALVAAGAWRYRTEVSTAWPAAEHLYAAVGIRALPPGFGLDLAIDDPGRAVREGAPVVSVAGRIENTSSRVRRVPRLRGALLDRDGREMRNWTFAAPVSSLPPRGKVRFRTEIGNAPDDAVRVSIAFHQPE